MATTKVTNKNVNRKYWSEKPWHYFQTWQKNSDIWLFHKLSFNEILRGSDRINTWNHSRNAQVFGTVIKWQIKHHSQTISFKVKVASVEVLRKVNVMVMKIKDTTFLGWNYPQSRSAEMHEQKDFSQKMSVEELMHLPKLFTALRKDYNSKNGRVPLSFWRVMIYLDLSLRRKTITLQQMLGFFYFYFLWDWASHGQIQHFLNFLGICVINSGPARTWVLLPFISFWGPEKAMATASTTKAMASHSTTLAWKIPWTEEPGGLQSMGSLRVRHDWATSLSLFMHWRRKWQLTPVFLPGESQGQGSLVGCSPWGR